MLDDLFPSFIPSGSSTCWMELYTFRKIVPPQLPSTLSILSRNTLRDTIKSALLLHACWASLPPETHPQALQPLSVFLHSHLAPLPTTPTQLIVLFCNPSGVSHRTFGSCTCHTVGSLGASSSIPPQLVFLMTNEV